MISTAVKPTPTNLECNLHQYIENEKAETRIIYGLD